MKLVARQCSAPSLQLPKVGYLPNGGSAAYLPNGSSPGGCSASTSGAEIRPSSASDCTVAGTQVCRAAERGGLPSPGRSFDEAQRSPGMSPNARSRPSRPWRKSRAECLAEDAEAQTILAPSSEAAEGVGVDPGALLFCLSAQECLDAPPPPPPCGRKALARRQTVGCLPSENQI